MKKSLIVFALVLSFFLCLTIVSYAIEPPSGVKTVNETISGKCDGELRSVNMLMEYKKTTDIEWTKINNTFVSGLSAGDYEVRYAETSAAPVSESVTVTIKEGRKLKVTFQAEGVTVATYDLSYGDKIDTLPKVPEKAGYDIAVWDKTDFSYVTEDIVVNAIYSAGSHAVLLPINTEGYTITSDAGLFVDFGKSFTFTVKIKEGYSKTEYFAVKLNGKTVTLNTDGSYTIPSVTEDYAVTVEGVADISAPIITLETGGMKWNEVATDTGDFTYVKEKPEIKVSAIEKGSGIFSLEIAVSSFALSQKELSNYQYWTDYTDNMKLSENMSSFVYVRAIDKSGNITYVGSVGIIYDATAPALNLNENEIYYGTKTVKVEDEHLDFVTVDGKKSSASFSLNPSDKNYTVVAFDKAGNKTELSVSVKRATPIYTVPTDLSAILGQTLADVKLPTTENGVFIWSSPLSTSVGNIGENKFSVNFIPYNTVDYQTVTGIVVTVTVSYQAHNPPTDITATDETVKGIEDGKIHGVNERMEYRRAESTEWIAVTGKTVDGLSGGTYYVRYAASSGYEASPFVEVAVKDGRMLTVTFKADGEVVKTVETAYGQSLVDIPNIPAKIGYNHTSPHWDVTDFSFIVSDMTVNAVYVANSYPVTFSKSDRFTVNENTVGSPVEYGKTYSFFIEVSEDYMRGLYFAVRDNGELIYPDENGLYTIENVEEAHNIEITGLVSNVSAEKNTVVGIDLEKHYAIGDRLEFTAVGSGMNNKTPEIGDERYVPISWTGYYTTSWDDEPYNASFTLYREGEFTVTVIYQHEMYNMNGWIPYGGNERYTCTIQVHKLPDGLPSGNATVSTVVCIVLIAAFTGVFITWYVIKTKKYKNKN